MEIRNRLRIFSTAAVLTIAVFLCDWATATDPVGLFSTVETQSGDVDDSSSGEDSPPASRPNAETDKADSRDEKLAEEQLHANPLYKAIAEARKSLQYIHENVRDYSCLAVRRERVEGKLRPFEYFAAKVRHKRESSDGETPFSLYLRFLAPASVKNREVLFVSGRYRNKMHIHKGGTHLAHIRTRIDPESRLALKDNRYPVTEFGIENLLVRLIAAAEDDLQSSAEVKVEFYRNAEVNGRTCKGIKVVHPRKEDSTKFHIAKVYLDSELNVPVHFESYGWPEEDQQPYLLEQYTYTKIKLNVGLTDVDFDPENPQYGLKIKKEE